MNKILFKELWRSIRRTATRFLSILAIVAVGTGFFAGVKASCPDMELTAKHYFEDTRLMDLHLLSTLGFTQEEIQAIAARDGVRGVMPAYSADCFMQTERDGNIIVHALSLDINASEEDENYLNRPVLKEGRLPQASGECVVEHGKFSAASCQIGDKISLFLEEGSLENTLRCTEYTVVGIVESSQYISFTRGNCLIGDGKIDLFIMLPLQDFMLEVYTDAYLTLKDTKGLSPFSDRYKDTVNTYAEETELFAAEQAQKRYSELAQTAQEEIDKGKVELENARQEAENLLAGMLLISGGVETPEYLQAKALAEEQLAAGEAEIAEAEKQLEQLECKWYVQTRSNNPGYSGYQDDAEKVDAIAKVFPIFFVLIAALVCLTTMTRMVEEERSQIGTMKALGYGKSAVTVKYLAYAVLASLLGSAVGLAVGFQLFPRVIIGAYTILYSMPKPITPFRWDYAAACTAAAVLCTGVSAYAACRRSMHTRPAQLMRPRAPKNGKRVFLERIGFIWSRLSFTYKVTVRNILRYKKRGIMTVIGIAGCTALLLTGFGLRYAVTAIAPKQYGEIFVYDAAAALNEEAEDYSALEHTLRDDPEISEHLFVMSRTLDAGGNGEVKSMSLYVPDRPENLEKYISLHEPNGKKLALTNDGVIMTEKLANMLGVKEGGTVTVYRADGKEISLNVTGIAENYAMHFIYISPELYQSCFGEAAEFNMLLLNTAEGCDHESLSQRLLAGGDILGISYTSEGAASFMDTMKSLDSIVWVLILSAGALAFIVMYNLVNINVNERLRELATIKVLGFYNKEVSAYIYRENNIAAFFGMMFGLVFGIFLERFVIATAEVEAVMFASDISAECFLFAALLTAFFTVVVNISLHFRLKKINMVEALKSVE